MDWNNDGLLDIICGDRNGLINYFERNRDGTLKAKFKLRDGDKRLNVGSNSSPDFIDWDNDGDFDMIVGSEGKYPDGNSLRLYTNVGTASAYKFDGYTEISAGGSVPTFFRGMPSIYDMNKDGLFDIVVGSSDKKFHYFENTGRIGKPSFAADNLLRFQAGGEIVAASATRLDVNDWNEDGLPDLVTGNSSVYVHLYTAKPGVSIDESTTGFVVPSALSMNENPVRLNLSVTINLGAQAVADLTVYTIDGRALLTHTTGKLAAGYNTVTIPNNLSNGTYILQCFVGNRELTERFVVVR